MERDSTAGSIAPSDSISNSNTIPVTVDLPEDHPKPTAVRTATCWYFFHFPEGSTAKTIKCYYCKLSVTYNKSSSSNLTSHAVGHHKRLYNEFDRNSPTAKAKTKKTVQKEISVQQAPRYDVEKSHEFFIQWIISDSQAFRVGENPFFQEWVKQ